MNESVTLRRLRTFLRTLAAVLFGGTVVELLLTGHVDSPIQTVPFALCGLGLLALAAVWLRPGRGSIRALRLIMIVVACGSAVGVAQHVSGNLEFGRETQPDAPAVRLLVAALTGAAPLLAPGILAVAASLAVAATYGTGCRKPAGSLSGDKV